MVKKCNQCARPYQLAGSSYLCGCGKSAQLNSAPKDEVKSVFLSLAIVSVSLAALFFHLFQWGTHSLSILTANQAEKVSICSDLKKYSCVEDTLLKLYKQTKDVEHLSELAQLQFRMQAYEKSRETYGLYFSKVSKKENKEALYYYAHSLAKTDRVDAAIENFDELLKQNAGIIMVTVIESYLSVLVKNNRFKKASSVLNNLKKRSRGAMNMVEYIKNWKEKFSI